MYTNKMMVWMCGMLLLLMMQSACSLVFSECSQIGATCTSEGSYEECYWPGTDAFVRNQRDVTCEMWQVCVDGKVNTSDYNGTGSTQFDDLVDGAHCVDNDLTMCDPDTFISQGCVNGLRVSCVTVDQSTTPLHYVASQPCEAPPQEMSDMGAMSDVDQR